MAKKTTRKPPRNAPKEAAADGARIDAIVAASDASDALVGGASIPDESEIRERAYLRYLERGGGDGHDFQDWVEAERELKKRT
jgi:hypothetical protein